MIESAVTLLPHPDSPRSATVSPSSMSQETSSTARTIPPEVENWVTRDCTDNSVPTTPECNTAVRPARDRPQGVRELKYGQSWHRPAARYGSALGWSAAYSRQIASATQ